MLLLSVLLVLTMMPAAAFVSNAATLTKVNAGTMDELFSYLSSTNNYDITVTKDLELRKDGSYTYWCAVHGTKALNLNGHSVLLHNNTNVRHSTMFTIATDGDLVIYDTANSSNSWIRYNAYIDDAGTAQNRNVFDVYGKLTMNGGTIEAGRSKSFYSAKYAKTVWKQTFGIGATIRKNGTLTVNAGTIYGRGRYLDRYAAIVALQGSNVYFNNGSVRAKGGADCFQISQGANVRVALGTFTCDTLDAIKIEGSITQGYEKGKVGLGKATQAPQAQQYATSSLENSTSLTLYPTAGKEVVKGRSGTTSGNSIRLLSSNPVLYTTNVTDANPVYGYNFRNVDTSTRGISYGINYRWMLWQDDTHILADTGYVLSKKEINVMKDFSGVTLEKGKTYYLRAFYREDLMGAVFAGSNQDISFTVVDDLAAPVITKNLPSGMAVKEGQPVNLQITASGTNLSYRWQLYNSSMRAWGNLVNGTGNTFSLSKVTADMNGRVYRCIVSNSAGSVTSQTCTLNVSASDIALSRIDLFDLDTPVMGQPLDFTAASLTEGVTVQVINWEILAGDELGDIAPAAGMSVDAVVNIHLADGYTFANPCTAYLDGRKQLSSSAATATDKEVSFSFDVAAPPEGAVIDVAYLDFEHGKEPAVGSTPEYVVVREIPAYDDSFNRDVRYTDKNDTWYREDGTKMPFTEAFQAGKSYTVETTLVPNSEFGWKFTEASKAELNGEPMDVQLSGQNLIVRKTYSLADDSTAEPMAVDSVTLNKTTASVQVGKTVTLTATVKPDNATDKTVTWSTSDKSVATVSKGKVTGVKAGTATITAKAGGKSATCKVTVTSSSAAANPFVDVKDTDFFYEPVLWAVNHNPQITNGTDATHFSPNNTCTRAQVVTFMWRAAGEPTPSLTHNQFKDVKSSDYFYKAVLWAVENSITTGTSPDTFSPNDPCQRCQVVTFLWRWRGNQKPEGSSNPFVDIDSGAYYYNAVLWAVNHKPEQITAGTDATHFSPANPCTRGQIVTFLYREQKK